MATTTRTRLPPPRPRRRRRLRRLRRVMVGAAYAAVPLYDWFCRATGFGGTRRSRPRAGPDARPHDHACASTPMSSPACRGNSRRSRTRSRCGSARCVTVDYTRHQPGGARDPGQASLQRRRRSTVGAYFQQDQLLLLHRAAAEAGRDPRDDGRVLCRSGAGRRIPNAATTSTPSRCPTPSIRVREPAAHRSPPSTSDRRPVAGRVARISTDGDDEMADATPNRHHDYHLVDPSPWPAVGSISAFVMAVGAIFWMHKMLRGCAARVRRRRARRALHHDRLVARRHPRGASTTAITPAWCRSRTATG